jgi:hypothetical protein
MAAVDGFGWVQGNGGGISQRGRFNASAMAEEDAWETVNLYGRICHLLGYGICICLRTRWSSFFVWRGRQCSRARAWALACTVASVVSSGPSEDGYKEEGRPRRLSLNQRCYYLLQASLS